MTILLLGLVIFFSAHALRIFAPDWRARQRDRLGELLWKALYSLVSIAGFALIVWGFGLARVEPVVLWQPPHWLARVTELLTLPAFILLLAAYVPRNRIKAAVGHPMLLAVKIWAFAHLLANGRVHDLVLFGSFMIWAAIDFATARRQDRVAGKAPETGTVVGDVVVVVAGIGFWAVFAMVLHGWLIGVKPFG